MLENFDPETNGQSKDIVADNIAQLKKLFPEVFSEDKIDFDALQTALGNYIETTEERYNFTWHGKSQAKRIAQTPSTGTLRPCKAESKDWDTTQNLFIEGDNLEVLKLLQKAYHKQVKMIYIDPPYNTGKEFIYPDNYQDNLDTYLEYTGQKDSEGRKFGTNTETSGRYHTNWLNMMYPRLKLARNLLRNDGVIIVTIGEQELTNARKICDEIFGEENFAGMFIWEKKKKPSFLKKTMGTITDYLICYAKNYDAVGPFIAGSGEEGKKYPFNNAGNSYSRLVFKPGSVTFSCADQIIPAQDMSEGNIKTVLINDLIIENGKNKNILVLEGEWRYSQASLDEFIENGDEIRISKVPFRPNYINNEDRIKKAGNLLSYRINGIPTNEDASEEIETLFGNTLMDYPKPTGLLKFLINAVTDESDLVLDFFAGSSSTADAVIRQNIFDNSQRRFLMVQLPEPCDEKSEAYKSGFNTIAEIGKERIRRAGEKIKADNADKDGIENLDIGFKVFKLDSSNIKPWDADFAALDRDLEDSIENIKKERTSEDVLYELLVKYGIDLTIPIETHTIEGKSVYSVGLGALLVCLDDGISLNVVEGIGKLKEQLNPETVHVVLKDAGLKDDVVKTNAIQILKRYGINDVKTV